MTPRTDRPTKNVKVPHNKGLLDSGKLDDELDKSQGGVSKYSAVVFTNPNEEKLKKSIEKPEKAPTSKAESEEEYSDDDFEDDFEPYETSNEEDNVK